MCCKCCSETQRKIWVFGFGIAFVALGTTLLILWPSMSEKLMRDNLMIQPGTKAYKMWVEAPVPIYLEFYLFNWTNPEEIRNHNVKPHFVEMGPYVYLEKHLKQNITFHANGTVSYFQKRSWFFDAERSNGTEQDMVTAAHAITAAVADQMRGRSKIVKKVINFMLNREGGHLYVTKPVGEWIFRGYQDDLIDFLKLFNTSKINIPYTRFAWMADRNGSAEYDGHFTIDTGVYDISNLGQLSLWNGRNENGFYELPCGTVNGTTGDVFPPHMNPEQEITLYVTDACRFLNIAPSGTYVKHDVEAVRYVGTIETLDSGENYPNQKCFCNAAEGECPKTGVVECKKCRNNAPIYASFPHFYLADESYVNGVSGLKANKEKHEFMLAVEPITGIPLAVNARLQINLLIEPDNAFDIYRGVPKVLLPMFWFQQKVELSKELAESTKLAIHLPDYGKYFAISLICLGAIFFIAGIALTLTKRWKPIPAPDEDMLVTSDPVML